MGLSLIAVGKKMPDWVYQSFNEYNKRLPDELQLNLVEISPATRSKAIPANVAIKKEIDAIQKKIAPGKNFIVLLDENGKEFSSIKLSLALESWQSLGKNICFIIGGPDGVNDEFRNNIDMVWSLSKLTFPHGMTRVILAEQIYRAWSIHNNHPYHRE